MAEQILPRIGKGSRGYEDVSKLYESIIEANMRIVHQKDQEFKKSHGLG